MKIRHNNRWVKVLRRKFKSNNIKMSPWTVGGVLITEELKIRLVSYGGRVFAHKAGETKSHRII